MLGTTHADVVKLFQSVPIGQSVTLVLCRGYPLPFDPEDPSAAASASLTPIGLEHRPLVVNGRTSYDPYLEYLSLSSQLPPQALAQAGAPHPGDTHLDGSSLPPTTPGSAPANTPHEDVTSSGTPGMAGATAQGAEILTVTMIKGAEGFGFTIADSPTGQRVKQVSSLASRTRWRGFRHVHCFTVFPVWRSFDWPLELNITLSSEANTRKSSVRHKLLSTQMESDLCIKPSAGQQSCNTRGQRSSAALNRN